MPKKDYQKWSQGELIDEIRNLQRRKKYGMVWEDKPEDVMERSKTELPVLDEVSTRAIQTDPDLPTNIMIEGDNFHALTVLNYTHKGKVDVIYIDPPYNTGNQTWKYNNKIVEKDDPWKHTLWVSMMYKRLKLAKNLLKKDGSLIVAIDDYEVHHLGLLLEELFPKHEIDLVIVEHHPQGAGSNTVSRTHEYAFICTPPNLGFKGRQAKEGEDSWSLKRSGQGENNWRINRHKSFFAVHVDEATRTVVGIGPEIPKDVSDYPTDPTKEGYKRIYPIDREGKERVWRYNRATMQKHINDGLIEYTQRGALTIKKDSVSLLPVFSIWSGSRYNAGTHGSTLLTKIMGTTNTFDYPKSLWTVFDMIKLVHDNKSAVILDFFAGSGTTGHAVLEMNKQDGGNRKFILCTNNENGIAEEVCYPRIQRVIEGFENKGAEKFLLFDKRITPRNLPDVESMLDEIEDIKAAKESEYEKFDLAVEDNNVRLYGLRVSDGRTDGLGGNLKYFATNFVPAEPTDRNKVLLTKRATKMLCLKEDTFETIHEDEHYSIFNKGKRYTGIIFDHMKIEDFKKKIAKIDGKFSVYIFSLGDDTFEEEFEDVASKVKLSPIPEAILRVYRRIFS